jgi:hypothetical protein
MLSKQEEQAERRETLDNDRRVREQGSTYLAHTHNDTGGRFSAISNPTVVGSSQIPKYPAAYLNHDPVPTEPALGVDINEMEPVGQPHEIKATLGPPCLSPAAPPNPSSQAFPPLADEGLGSFSSRTFRRF